ncbi:ankyrin repeat-containing domain protein [Aspergillus venezuelensis]
MCTQTQVPVGLSTLPVELILLVTSHLEFAYDINAFCLTPKRLNVTLNPILYKHSITPRNGGCTLEWAAITGSASTCRLILEAGAPPDACGEEDWQPFALAAIHGSSDVLKLLHERGIDPCSTNHDWKNHLVNEKGIDDWTEGHPLSMAAEKGHISVVRLLLEHAEKGHLEVVRLLADVESQINAQEGHLDVVQFLLSRGADPNLEVENDDLLTKHNYDPNLQVTDLRISFPHRDLKNIPKNALTWAVERNQTNAINILLSHGANIESVSTEETSSTATYSSIKKDNSLVGGEEVLRLLLDRGVEFPSTIFYDGTAGEDLNLAATHEGILLMELLLDMGFDLQAGDNAGQLLYSAAKAKDDPDALLDFLLENGCSIDENQRYHSTALLQAARYGDEGAMRRLLLRGANPLATMGTETALSIAVKTVNVAAVELVLAALKERDMDFRALEKMLNQAEKQRMQGEEFRKKEHPPIPRVDFFRIGKDMRRFYWCRRHPVPT